MANIKGSSAVSAVPSPHLGFYPIEYRRRKRWTATGPLGHQGPDAQATHPLCTGPEGSGPQCFLLKACRCPFCGKTGTLNRHSLLTGNHPVCADGKCWRGQRVFCCNRGQRGGCGGTFSILFSHIIPRHTFTAPQLWTVMKSLAMTGHLSIKAAWERAGAPLSLEGFYHLLQRWRRRISSLRPALCRIAAPPAGRHADPLKQTIEHLHAAFSSEKNALSAFQMRFQRSVTG